jgi:hypothetical protein
MEHKFSDDFIYERYLDGNTFEDLKLIYDIEFDEFERIVKRGKLNQMNKPIIRRAFCHV